jgi:plasmid stabilization system protein ParE
MKNILISALCLLSLTACITSGDLRALADVQETYHQKTEAALEKIADSTATKEQVDEAKGEIKDASTEFKEAVEAIAKEVEERTEATLTGLPESAEGGLVGILAAVALNFYRNSTRKKDLEKSKGKTA